MREDKVFVFLRLLNLLDIILSKCIHFPPSNVTLFFNR